MADNGHGLPRITRSFKGSERDSRTLWTNFTPGKGKSKNDWDAQAAEQTKYLEASKLSAQLVSGHANDSSVDIWKQVNGGSNLPDIYGQSSVQSLMGLKPGDDVVWFDFENVGTSPHQRKAGSAKWYSPLELAMQKTRVNADNTVSRVGEHLSLLLKPTKDDLTQMDGLVNKIKGLSGKTWTGLSADEWRSANDLILYAHDNPFDETSGLFEKRGDVTHIKRQNRLGQLAGDGRNGRMSVFSSKHVELMQKGMNNLKEHGNSPDVVARQLVEYFNTPSGKFKLGGFNIQNFDVPMMMDWIEEKLAPGVQDSQIKKSLNRLKNDLSNVQKIDSRQILNTVYKDKATRFGPNGLTQEGLADVLGLNKGTAHVGIDDVWTNIQLHNKLVSNHGLMETVNGGFKGAGASFNSAQLNAGDKLFAVHGIANDKAGKWDNIFHLNKEGGYEPAYDMKLNPLSKNTEYSVVKKFFGKMQDGKDNYGVVLKNEDTGYHHMFARETLPELQNLIHGTMVPSSEAASYMEGSKSAGRVDKARRRWDKMFDTESGGGRKLIEKMMKVHEVAQEGSSLGLKGESLKQAVLNDERLAGARVTPELYRDYDEMKGRFGSEAGYLKEFLTVLDERLPVSNPQGTHGRWASHNVALQAYSKLLDKEEKAGGLGPNRGQLEHSGGYGSLMVGDNAINLSSQKTISQGINRLVDTKNQSSPVVRQRLNKLLTEAQAKGMSSARVQELRAAIGQLRDKQSPYVIIEEISSHLEQAARSNEVAGIKTIDMSNPTQVTRPIDRLKNKDFKEDIHSRAIQHASVFESRAWGEKGLNIADPKFREIMNNHNTSVQNLFNHVKGGSTLNIGVARAEETLANLVNSYSKNNVQTQLIYDGKRQGLYMVMAEQKIAEQVFGLQPNEILEHEKVARVAIPMLDGKGNISLPGQERIGRSKIFEDRWGNLKFGTAFEEVSNVLGAFSERGTTMIASGKVSEANSMLKGAVTRGTQKFSVNNKYMTDDDMNRQDTRMSKTARYARSGHVDLTDMARQWYQWMYAKDKGLDKKMDAKAKRMEKDKSLSFYNTLGKDELRQFQMTIDKYAQNTIGLQTNMHNIKDTHVANGLRSAANADVRNLLPFGYLDPMARENIVKHGNYLQLNEEMSKNNLRKAGVSEDRIERMMTRGLVTDVGKQVLDGETAFINLRTAYMDNEQLAYRMKKANITDQMASIYDGGIIIREDVAQAFTTTREKKVTLSEGATLPSSVQDLLKNSDMFENYDGSYAIKEGVGLSEKNLLSNFVGTDERVGSSTYGQYTVGQMAIGDTVRGVDYLKGQNPNVYVKGFDKEKGQLILETIETMRDGIKIGSDGGDRSTAIIRSKEWFQKNGLGDTEVINAYISGKKGMEGAKTRSVVSGAIDAVQEKYTVGKMATEEARLTAMNTLARIMKDELGVNEIAAVTKDQIIMKSVFGLDGKVDIGTAELNRFAQRVDEELGTKVQTDGVIKGNQGYTVADVYNWENQTGYVEGRSVQAGQGGVRWGYKETTMIERRANQALGEDNSVTKWLRSHMKIATESQGPSMGVDSFISGLHRSVLDATDLSLQTGKKALQAGELVVSAQTDALSVGDRAGYNSGREVGGVTTVSMNAFNDLPGSLPAGEKMTVGKYHKTILAAGQVDVDINGQTKSLQGIIDKNKGTFMFELPDNFSRKYVRMMDQDIIGLGENLLEEGDDGRRAVLQELQKSQLQIWRSVKEYNEVGGDDSKAAVEKAIHAHENNLSHATSSARKGSVTDMRSARMDMSGRFRIQGINPFVDGGANAIGEGEVVVGKAHMERMIKGAEVDILKAVGGDGFERYQKHERDYTNMIAAEKDAIKKKELRQFADGRLNKMASKYVLDYAQTEGLYGITGRYPTIETDTMQVMKMRWDEKVTGDVGHMNVATALTMNADHDGDFFSSVLAHYKTEAGAPSGAEMHKAFGQIHKQDTAKLNDVRVWVEDQLRNSDYGDKALDKLTVGDLAKVEGFQDKFQSKFGNMFDLESAIARTGKGDVGVLDNLRLKMFNVAEQTYQTLGAERGWDSSIVNQKIQHIEEFGRIVSQNAISSKKFQQADIRKTMLAENAWRGVTDEDAIQKEMTYRMTTRRYEALDLLVDGIKSANGEGIAKIRAANDVLGLFDNAEGYDDLPEAKRIAQRQRYSLDTLLSTLAETKSLVGERGWMNNRFLQVGVSEGFSTIEQTAEALRGQGGLHVNTPAVKGNAQASAEMSAIAERGQNIFRSTVLSNYDNVNGGDSVFDEIRGNAERSVFSQGATQTDNILGTATVAEGAGVKLRQVMGTVMGAGGGGMPSGRGAAWGAGMFGALWAGSALARGGPTPEGLQEQLTTEQFEAPQMRQGQPTARIKANQTGENINIRVNAKDAKGMSQDEISALVQSELGAMTLTQMNMNLNVNDNTQSLTDSNWFQGVIANTIDKGFGF